MMPEDHDRGGELCSAADAASRHAAPMPVEHIKRLAARRTRRRSALAGLTAIAVLAGAVTVAANASDRDGTNVVTSRPKTTATTAPVTATTGAAGPTTTSLAPGTTLPVIVVPTTVPTAPTTPRATTTTAPVARFRVRMEAPSHATVGETITVRVLLSYGADRTYAFTGDEYDPGNGDTAAFQYETHNFYRPSNPCRPGGGPDEFDYRYSYSSPGTYTITFRGRTCGTMAPAERDTATATIVVDPAPTPSTTTTAG